VRGVSVFILVVLFLFSLLLSPSRSLLLTLLLKLVAVLCCRPGEDARFLRGVSTKELGDAAAIRLSRDTGAVRTTVPGGSLEDTVKQQAATIHAQALKLHQLQGLLDFALKQKSEEDVEDEKRVRQLEEIIAFKDTANKDLKNNVRHLEDALAETKMNLEFMHSKWRDEAAAHEQALADLKAQSARIAHLEDEQRRHREREGETHTRVAAARSEALDRVQELQELQLRHSSTVNSFDRHQGVHAQIKERLGFHLTKLSSKGVKHLCFTHWLSKMDEVEKKNSQPSRDDM
jgi:vacuolar-type H+-ATPase subunit I/STV1